MCLRVSQYTSFSSILFGVNVCVSLFDGCLPFFLPFSSFFFFSLFSPSVNCLTYFYFLHCTVSAFTMPSFSFLDRIVFCFTFVYVRIIAGCARIILLVAHPFVRSFPSATQLPSVSEPTVLTANATHTLMDLWRTKALAASHALPISNSLVLFFSSLVTLLNPSQSQSTLKHTSARAFRYKMCIVEHIRGMGRRCFF